MTDSTEKAEVSRPRFTSKMVTLRSNQWNVCGEHVRIEVQQRDVTKSDFVACFTKRNSGVELQARALIAPSDAGGFEIVFSMSDFIAARSFVLEQWDLDDSSDDEDDEEDDADDGAGDDDTDQDGDD